MSLYHLTPQAEDDLFEVWSFIAEDNRDAADVVEAYLFAAFAFLSSTPYAGHMRPDVTHLPVRFWTLPRYSSYIVVYDPEARPLRIIRILHGMRHLPSQSI